MKSPLFCSREKGCSGRFLNFWRPCNKGNSISQIASFEISVRKNIELVRRKTWYVELSDVQAGFRKGRGARDQIAKIHWSYRKQGNSIFKKSTFVSLTMVKPLTVWITTNCGEIFKRWEYQTTLPASWETCMQIKKQQLEPDMQQQTGSKLGKEYNKAVYCNHAYLTYMQST